MAMVNTFISFTIVGVSYITADSYAITLKADWETLSKDIPDMSVEQAMSRISGTVNGLGDSAAGLISVLGSGIVASAYDLGGMSWLLTHVVEMEKFFVMGSGGIVTALSLSLGLDWPAGNYMFAPLQMCGWALTGLGLVQAVPFFQKKFPDLMFFFHRIQLVTCGALGVMFIVMLSTARNVSDFINENWEQCKYEQVCDLVGSSDFSFKQYANSNSMSKDDLELYMQPMMYAASISCLTSLCMVAGGSNLAKMLYHRTVMSRADEIASIQSGQDPAAARAAALTKKKRRTRQADISDISSRMQMSAITELEENALIMELATGSPMEEHYDLVAHDAAVADIKRAADVESSAAELGVGVESGMEGKLIDFVTSSEDVQTTSAELPEQQTAGIMDTGSKLVSLARAVLSDGISSNFHDARADEPHSLESRVQGAKDLLSRTKQANLAGWANMEIFTKREHAYKQAQQENSSSDADPIIASIPSISNLFETRL